MDDSNRHEGIPATYKRYEGGNEYTQAAGTSTVPIQSLLPHCKLNLYEHDRIVNELATKICGFASRGEKFRIYHGSSNSTRPRSTGKMLDVSALNNVLFISDRMGSDSWCVVEPNVPMDKLVESTMKHGLVPPVVMEFPGITAGGGFSGTSAESSSFRHGYFSDNVHEVEMILGNGQVIKASNLPNDDRRDLFRGAAGALGTLGIVTMMKMRLVEAKRFVHVHYCRLSRFPEAIGELDKKKSGNFEYLDGIMFSKQHAVAITGSLIDEKCIPKDAPIKTFSNAEDDWFYRHVGTKTKDLIPGAEADDYVPLAEYLFRYDRGGFWVGELGYNYFRYIPFNGFMRWLLDDFSHTRTLYHALHATGVSRELIVQDVAVPRKNAVDLISCIGDELRVWPLWLCPLGKPQLPTFHPAASEPGSSVPEEMLNIGIWGWGPQDFDQFVAKNRGLEKKLEELGGRKWLYAHTFYTEEEFWRVYDRRWYEELREKYHATNLTGVYDKAKRDAGEKRGWAQTLMEMWPVGGLYGMWLAMRSGDISLHRDATWKWVGGTGAGLPARAAATRV